MEIWSNKIYEKKERIIMVKEVVSCAHIRCLNCDYPLFVECDFVDDLLTQTYYDDTTEDSTELTHCPSCKVELTDLEY